MKREQIIEFAKKHIYIEYKKAGFGTYQELGGLEEFANAVLALPLDLPSDEEIDEFGNKERIEDFMPETLKLHIKKKNECRIEGARWAIDKIIKRNQK